MFGTATTSSPYVFGGPPLGGPAILIHSSSSGDSDFEGVNLIGVNSEKISYFNGDRLIVAGEDDEKGFSENRPPKKTTEKKKKPKKDMSIGRGAKIITSEPSQTVSDGHKLSEQSIEILRKLFNLPPLPGTGIPLLGTGEDGEKDISQNPPRNRTIKKKKPMKHTKTGVGAKIITSDSEPSPPVTSGRKLPEQSLEILRTLLKPPPPPVSRRLPDTFRHSGSQRLEPKGKRGTSPACIKRLMDGFTSPSGLRERFQDMDILDIAKMKGIEFENPKWWRPGGYAPMDPGSSGQK